MKVLFLIVFFLLPASHAFAEMKVSFSWGETKKCFDTNSPPFKVTGVPADTKTLSFAMRDLDAPDFHHGGGKVTYSGKGDIPYGAFKYKGPCPPSRHTYQFTVKALDAKGKELASARARKAFP